MSAHTPTPWISRPDLTERINRTMHICPIYSGGCCVSSGRGTSHEIAVANAAFTVRAVNGHDALYAISKEIADFQTCAERGIFLNDRPSRDVALDELILTARAEHARAEGRAE